MRLIHKNYILANNVSFLRLKYNYNYEHLSGHINSFQRTGIVEPL